MEKTISFHSDGKLIKINKVDGVIKILYGSGRINTTIPISKILDVRIDIRKNKFKPDAFFIGYAILSTVISIAIVKLLFKNIPTLNITVTISVVVAISIILQIKMANKKQALFIETPEKTIEIPIDETAKAETVKTFLKKQ